MKTSLLSAALLLPLALLAHAQVVINEIRIDDPSTDDFEFFELFNAGAGPVNLGGLTYVVIGDGAGGSGVIEDVVTLPAADLAAGARYLVSNQATLLIDQDTDGVADLTGIPDVVNVLQFENSDNVTHLLVEGFSGADNDDLDTNDDGALDVTPWTTVVDAIGLVETPAAGEFFYGASLGGVDVGPSGTFVPAHVYRSPDGGGWNIGSFGSESDPGTGNLLQGTQDTPGFTNPDVIPLTLVLSAPSVAEDAGAAALTGTVSRPGTTGDQEVTISVDDGSEAFLPLTSVFIVDGSSSAMFDIDTVDDLFPDGTQTVTVTVSGPAAISDSQTFDVTDNGDAFSLVINELYLHPDDITGDANGDGQIGSNDDEFIEIVNVSGGTIDLSGLTLNDSNEARGPIHVFRDGTVLDNGCAIVVFGGGDLFDGVVPGRFGNAEVQKSSEGLLFLSDGGDFISLRDALGQTIHDVVTPNVFTGTELGSYNLNIDADGSSGYARHTVIASDAGNQYSPGTTVAGSDFCPAPAQTLTVSISPASLPENAGAGAGTITVSIPANASSDLLVVLETSDSSEAVPQFPGGFILTGTSSVDIPLDIADDTVIDGTQTVTISAAASGYANGTDTIDVTDDGDVPPFTNLVINEVDADQTSTDSAEFVELYNLTGGAESLNGLVLVLINGNGDTVYNAFDLSGQMIGANGFFVVGAGTVPGAFTPGNFPATNAIQNGADAVALYVGSVGDFPSGTAVGSITNQLIDAVVYGTNDGDDAELLAAFGGTQINESANGTSATDSVSRNPDGTGAFAALPATPGATNVPAPAGDPDIRFIFPDFAGGNVVMNIANLSNGVTYSLNSSAVLGNPTPFAQVLTFTTADGVDGGGGVFQFSFADASIGSKAKNFYQVTNP